MQNTVHMVKNNVTFADNTWGIKQITVACENQVHILHEYCV